MSNTKKAYLHKPDYAVSPGDTLLENLEHLGMTQTELAKRMDRPIKTINEIINGKAAITPETAIQLELVLGIPAGFWNNLEKNYRVRLAEIEEQEKLKQSQVWLKDLPLRELIKYRIIPEKQDVREQIFEVLKFFGVSSPKSWNDFWKNFWDRNNVHFRKSNKSSPAVLAAWLRVGELKAQRIKCQPFNKKKFEFALKEARKLTIESPDIFINKLTGLCAEAGVALVFFPEFKKACVCGATRWLTSEKALIQLSLRYKTDDHLWFTFFHEAAHILLHGKKDIFLEFDSNTNEKEEEANQFAAQYLIPQQDLNKFTSNNKITSSSIQQFAKKQGISPGIVVGRLQHEKQITYSQYNILKRRFDWATGTDNESQKTV